MKKLLIFFLLNFLPLDGKKLDILEIFFYSFHHYLILVFFIKNLNLLTENLLFLYVCCQMGVVHWFYGFPFRLSAVLFLVGLILMRWISRYFNYGSRDQIDEIFWLIMEISPSAIDIRSSVGNHFSKIPRLDFF